MVAFVRHAPPNPRHYIPAGCDRERWFLFLPDLLIADGRRRRMMKTKPLGPGQAWQKSVESWSNTEGQMRIDGAQAVQDESGMGAGEFRAVGARGFGFHKRL